MDFTGEFHLPPTQTAELGLAWESQQPLPTGGQGWPLRFHKSRAGSRRMAIQRRRHSVCLCISRISGFPPTARLGFADMADTSLTKREYSRRTDFGETRSLKDCGSWPDWCHRQSSWRGYFEGLGSTKAIGHTKAIERGDWE